MSQPSMNPWPRNEPVSTDPHQFNDKPVKPWYLRWSFLLSMVLVIVVIVGGTWVVVKTGNTTHDANTATSTGSTPTDAATSTGSTPADAVSTTGSTPTTTAPVPGGASICGLPDGPNHRLSTAPATDAWDYHDVFAYPVSATYGPGKTAPAGFVYCYQHSPEGALFMAANQLAQVMVVTDIPAYAEYLLAPGPTHDTKVAEWAKQMPAHIEEVKEMNGRASVRGFRLLSYTGDTATVDIAAEQRAGDGQGGLTSTVYKLMWADGDWRLNINVDQYISGALIPSLSGYISWSP